MAEPPPDSLYVPLTGGRFLATRLTQGPWAADRQHGGPVAALLACVLESQAPPGWLTPQLTVDFLTAAPIAELTVAAEVIKDGRRARCVRASLYRDGRACAQACGWQVAPGGAGAAAAGAAGTMAAASPPPLPPTSSYGRARFGFGYLEAVELRFVRGSLRERAPATAWARLAVPLLPATPPSPLQRVAAVADFSSGISAILDRAAWSFHNLDLTLHLHRYPAGEWICLDAASTAGPDGTGTCRAVLHDADGPFGSSAQSLLLSTATQMAAQ
jgi:acyl-Coa thioesterase superfamily protein/acyl-CoA thioesterase superfamily protein